jgi:L-serine dehydratase
MMGAPEVEVMEEFVSIFNDVMGPVMRGPSSSHTAGAYHIGKMMRCLLNDEPVSARFTFDPSGSYAPTYLALGVDLAFATGVMGWSMLDADYPRALERVRELGIDMKFEIAPVELSDHPNAVRIEIASRRGKTLQAVAEAKGGGVVRFINLEGWPVSFCGKSHEVLVVAGEKAEPQIREILDAGHDIVTKSKKGKILFCASRPTPLGSGERARLDSVTGIKNIWMVCPIFYVKKGEEVFSNSEEMIRAAEDRGCSLGGIAAIYESELLGMGQAEVREEMLRRFDVMSSSVHDGLDDTRVGMLLLRPTASRIHEAEAKGTLAVGGIHLRAAARSMAVMHVCNSRGVICAAPTGGSSGVIPGVVVTLAEEKGLSPEQVARVLFAASAVGLIVAKKATFAAEVAGCQVEIGVAGAMAAAAVVEFAGGSPRQATDAAAIALQNTMGSVCDPVAGAGEIPCHTRNAVAASNAFVCADLVLGGYHNPIPLDETIDASYAVGKALPRQLRCTAAGGIAVTPSALSLPRLR